jgi:DNA-binding CsgD family transcriptional regulator
MENGLDGLLTSQSEYVLFNRIAGVARELGFTYCAYGIRFPSSLHNPKIVLFSNYASKWKETYTACGYQDVDPNIRHCLTSSLPVVWTPQFFAGAAELWEDMRSHGIRFGWTHACRDENGAIGGLCLARTEGPITAAELQVKQAKMAWLTHYAHISMAMLLIPLHMPELAVTFTSREREILRWTAEGKTAYEVGLILGITPRTINFHIQNVLAKMGVSNKIQAAVKAARVGLLA